MDRQMIPADLYTHPRVDSALSRARDILDNWAEALSDQVIPGPIPSERSPREYSRRLLFGWDSVSLTESIATKLLEAEGFDIEGLTLTVEDPRPGETPADSMTRFNRNGFDEKWWGRGFPE